MISVRKVRALARDTGYSLHFDGAACTLRSRDGHAVYGLSLDQAAAIVCS